MRTRSPSYQTRLLAPQTVELVDRIRLLACCFAVEVYAYCIMSNHFHLVARYDPLACWRWSDEEVARRWV